MPIRKNEEGKRELFCINGCDTRVICEDYADNFCERVSGISLA